MFAWELHKNRTHTCSFYVMRIDKPNSVSAYADDDHLSGMFITEHLKRLSGECRHGLAQK